MFQGFLSQRILSLVFLEETDEDFMETLDLVKANFERFYIYFSPREGTPAAKFKDDIELEVKKARLYKLNQVINDGYLQVQKIFR